MHHIALDMVTRFIEALKVIEFLDFSFNKRAALANVCNSVFNLTTLSQLTLFSKAFSLAGKSTINIVNIFSALNSTRTRLLVRVELGIRSGVLVLSFGGETTIIYTRIINFRRVNLLALRVGVSMHQSVRSEFIRLLRANTLD